jgi:SAM-dependent methyltransferase
VRRSDERLWTARSHERLWTARSHERLATLRSHERDVSARDDERGTRAFYDAIAGRYDRVYATRIDGKARLVEACRALLPASRTLVLGVGTGRELSALCDAGHAPTGLDFSPRMLEKATRRGRPVPLVQGDFWEPLPFLDGMFDGAVALHGTLAHAPNDAAIRRLASELSRVLVSGGKLVVEVPSLAWFEAIGDQALEDDYGRVVRRIDKDELEIVDLPTGAVTTARALSAETWRELLTPFDVQVEGREDELLLVGTNVRRLSGDGR